MKKNLCIISIMILLFSISACEKMEVINEKNNVEEKNTEVNVIQNENKMGDFSCKTNKGNVFTLYSRNDKKPVFINFWATWCGPCVGELPDLQDLYDEYKDKVNFIFINCGDSEEIISSFLNEMQGVYTFPVGYDENNEIAMKFDITGIPTTYILDGDNNISDKVIGARSKNDYKKLLDKVVK